METQHTKTVDNGVDLETLCKTIEAIRHDPELGKSRFRVRNTWLGGGRNRTEVLGFYGGGQEMSHKQSYELKADEPPVIGGTDEAPNPVEHLLNALGACLTTSIVSHAAVHGIEIEQLESEIEGDLDLQGFLGLDDTVPRGYKDIRVKFWVKTAPENIEKLKSFAMFSPVYNTVTKGANVDIQIESK
ncbi:MAG: OsmC family protein [Planctomycetota bacterium]|jgi:uncharacterized OsmC-like protein